jgi:hypothetical protein
MTTVPLTSAKNKRSTTPARRIAQRAAFYDDEQP